MTGEKSELESSRTCWERRDRKSWIHEWMLPLASVVQRMWDLIKGLEEFKDEIDLLVVVKVFSVFFTKSVLEGWYEDIMRVEGMSGYIRVCWTCPYEGISESVQAWCI